MPDQFWTAAEVIGRKNAELAKLKAELVLARECIANLEGEQERAEKAEAERDDARAAAADVTGLHLIISEIRQIPGIGYKPMLSDLPRVIRALIAHASQPVAQEPVEAEARDWRADCMTLLANLDWLAECTGEGPEGEDRVIVEEIRTALNIHPGPAQVAAATPERQLADDILAELFRARAKFPGKNVTFAALIEEVGELATATFEESASRVRKEAVQVAVMAMRMVLDGDHCFDTWRAEKGLDHLDPAARAPATGKPIPDTPPPAWADGEGGDA